MNGAKFEGAILTGASLEDAHLIEANLADANLDAANLSRADLRQADLAGTSFVDAQADWAKLDGAVMSPARDRHGRLVRVNLTHANLSNAWARADLRKAVLVDARLVGTRLDPANLQGADLTGANLADAELRGANLKGANLFKARNLDVALDLSYVTYDGATQWPPGITWNDKPIIKCKTSRCTLEAQDVGQLSPALQRMRSKLTKAIDGRDCLIGWRVDDELLKVAAHTQNNDAALRATFRIQEKYVGATKPPDAFARSFGNMDFKPISSFKANGVPAYAERTPAEDTGLQRTEVAIYVVPRNGTGLRFVASAPAPLFQLFARDFVKLFRLVGVEPIRLVGAKPRCSRGCERPEPDAPRSERPPVGAFGSRFARAAR